MNTKKQVKRLRRPALGALVVVALAANVYYLGWRASSTLNPGALWLSILLLGAECYGFLTLLLHLFLIWDQRALERQLGIDPENSLAATELPDPPAGLSVDVLIPTYNEPLALLRNTIMAARRMRYPHSTWVLDDSRRPELELMCQELEVGYLTRPSNEDAKAGNINAALPRTEGEYIVVLDADFIALPNLLERTLGHFTDPGLAFVQLPQTFYNLDSIQHVGRGTPGAWHEQALFYEALQPGKNRWNAAFWCGSPAVVRRSALESVGGCATGCVTEDILTSMRIHAAGWRSLYHNETLAVGIAPGDLDGFRTQRLRWAQGSMQILRTRENPLLKRGLTLAQRLNYFASMTTYFQAVQLMIYAALPPIVLATGLTPITNLGWSFVERFVPYVVSTILVIKFTGGRSQRMLWDQYFAFLRTFTFLRALPTLITGGRRLTFKVTAKIPREHPSRRWLYPHLGIALINLAAVGCIAIEPSRTKLTLGTLIVVSTWSVLIGCVYLTVLLRLWNRTYRRRHYRAPVSIPVRTGFGGRAPQRSLTTELSFSGLSTRVSEPVEPGTAAAITLEIGATDVPITATVTRCTPQTDGYSVGLAFAHVPVEFEALLTEQVVMTTLLGSDARPSVTPAPATLEPHYAPFAPVPAGQTQA
jgi:cellulose synthase (UDP-forming)